jgi:transcription initiation factor IIE alpha subunit
MTLIEMMRASLQKSDFTVGELSQEVGCCESHVSRYISKQLDLGNVICIMKSTRKSGTQKVNARYSWGAESKEVDLLYRARLILLEIKNLDQDGINLIGDINDWIVGRDSELSSSRLAA